MDFYSEDQTYRLLQEMEINVVTDTSEVWMCYCPFHGNSNTPAFAVNKTNGTFICFNGACGASGDMLSLVTQVTGKSYFAAYRLVSRAKSNNPADFSKVLQKSLSTEPLPTFSQSLLDGMEAAFWASQEAQDYMYGRGFTKETLEHYHIGYSPKKRIIVVPMHDVNGNPVGIVGRSPFNKRFRNSDHLPKSRTLWNVHRAKRAPRAVICEASFDAMRVWQATGIEAMATLGSHFSADHAEQINKYFTHVVIMTDDDQKLDFKGNCRKCREKGISDCIGHNTGLELGRTIAKESRGLVVEWAHLDSLKRYDGMKDAGDMTDEQIRYAIDNSISNLEMVRMAPA